MAGRRRDGAARAETEEGRACIACGITSGVAKAWVCDEEVERLLSHGGNWLPLELKQIWFV